MLCASSLGLKSNLLFLLDIDISFIDLIYKKASEMQILIILSSNSPEIKWNAIRFGNFLLNSDEDVTIFLNGPGVDLVAV